MLQEITIRQREKPFSKNLEKDVHWLCDSLGFGTGRDVEHVSSRILLELLVRYREFTQVSSELLADHLSMSVARINHHIRNLSGCGLLYREKKSIWLRGGSLKTAVEELRKDANRIFDELSSIAGQIDDDIGLQNRKP